MEGLCHFCGLFIEELLTLRKEFGPEAVDGQFVGAGDGGEFTRGEYVGVELGGEFGVGEVTAGGEEGPGFGFDVC
jgi:hypothetical protein